MGNNLNLIEEEKEPDVVPGDEINVGSRSQEYFKQKLKNMGVNLEQFKNRLCSNSVGNAGKLYQQQLFNMVK